MGFCFRLGFRSIFSRARRLSGKTRCSVCLKYYKPASLCTLPQCHHTYCRTCLRRTFSRLVTDEPDGVIPPRCCGAEITLAVAADYLDSNSNNTSDEVGLKQQYIDLLEKRTEFPVFCARGCKALGEGATGGRFILPEDVKEEEDLAVCGECGGGTCTLCKGPAPHTEGDGGCVKEEEEKQEIRYERLSRRLGWRCCGACGMMVSRDVGCSHVVCRCGSDVWLAF